MSGGTYLGQSQPNIWVGVRYVSDFTGLKHQQGNSLGLAGS